MTPIELYDLIKDHGALTSLIVFVCSVIIEKSKTIKLNPFSYIGKLLTQSFMNDVIKKQDITLDEVAEVKNKCKTLSEALEVSRKENEAQHKAIKSDVEYEVKAYYMKQCRVDFFRFEEGIRRGVEYTKEHWHNMHNKVREYEAFCRANSKFINSECEDAMRVINEGWEQRLWENNNGSKEDNH